MNAAMSGFITTLCGIYFLAIKKLNDKDANVVYALQE